MRQIYASLIASLLSSAAPLAAQPCTASDAALCLTSSRFRVEVTWRDFQDRTGSGHAVPLTSDTGYFWFFDSANVELVVKVLDARPVNGKFWVFFGALSNVEYTLTVRDTVTGSTKTYLNPSGRFASVGDTGAFDGSAATSHQTVIVDGTHAPASSVAEIRKFLASPPAAVASASCPDTRYGFLLGGCRFHFDVEWNDGRGRTGRGHPVQLTNDTGYFWFFSPSNVELMVKVLDARGVNGSFWVFFGALSNVRYSITVTDSVTGSSRRYVNPSGTFASVGDTSAFRGGHSVGPLREAGRAVSADLDTAGGSLSATASDGSVFTLEIPPDALWNPETVTLTPVSRLDRFPFSGGLVAGVEIEPAGLTLLVPATLTIRPASPAPAERTLPYAYSRGGEAFLLYPRDPDTSSLRMRLDRFGGYGAGLGDAREAARQVARVPTGRLTPYVQRYAYEAHLHTLGRITAAELLKRGNRILREAWDELVAPVFGRARAAELVPLSTRRATCTLDPKDFEEMLEVIRQKQMLGLAEPSPGVVDNGLDEALEYLRTCQQEAFDRCVALNDPFEILRMAKIARQLALLGEEDPYLTTFIEGGLLERCLRFELDVESKIVEEGTAGPQSWVQRLKYRARHVPLRFLYGGNPYANRGAWDGECTLRPEVATLDYTPAFGCRVTVVPKNGWFRVPAAWIGVLDDPRGSAVTVLYEPGYPEVQASESCDSGAYIPDVPMTPFADQFHTLHAAEFLENYALYVAKEWDQLRFDSGPSQNGEFFAKKSYERPPVPNGLGGTLTEETWFFLKHTPDAPPPDCP